MNKKLLALVSLIVVMFALIAIPSSALLATRGDANTDNGIDMKDVLLIRKVIANYTGLTYDAIAADANADTAIDMKDILLVRRFVAGHSVTLAPYPSGSDVSNPTTQPSTVSTTQGGASGDDVKLTFSFLQEGKYEEDNITINNEWNYHRGDTATITAAVTLYHADGLSEAEVKGYFAWTPDNLTFNGFTESEIVDGNTTYTVTYTILMDGNKTVSGSSNGNKEKEYSFTANGAGGTTPTVAPTVAPTTPTTVPTVAPTVAPTTPSTVPSTPVGTTTTKGGSTGDEVTLTFSFLQKGKYSDGDVTIQKEWTYNRGDTATITAQFKVYNGAGLSQADVQSYFEWSTNNMTFVSYDESDIVDHNTTYTVRYSILMDSDKTVTGSSADKKEKEYTFTSNANGETDITSATTTTTMGNMPFLADDPFAIEEVTISFADGACGSYGFTWQTFVEKTGMEVQIVEAAPAAADFTGADVIKVTASNEAVSDIIVPDYDPFNGYTYTYDYAKRATYQNYTHYSHKASCFLGTTGGLKYDTTYSYRVGDPTSNVWSKVYTFTTRKSTVGDFTFLFLSDTQFHSDGTEGVKLNNILKAAESTATFDFMCHGGDFSDTGNYGFIWGNLLSNADAAFSKYPCFPTTGNHDAAHSQWGSRFNVETENNKGYYSYDYGDAHFVVLDNASDGLKRLNQDQLDFLQREMSNTTKTWKFVYMHRPVFSAQDDNSDSNSTQGVLRGEFLRICDQTGVDLVMQSHTHSYTVSYPMGTNGSGSYTKYSWNSTMENGVDYCTNPGHPLFSVFSITGDVDNDIKIDGKSSIAEDYLKYAEDGHHYSFTTVSVTSTKLTVNKYYVDDATKANPVVSSQTSWGIIK